MKSKNTGLGRGLDALFAPGALDALQTAPVTEEGERIFSLPLSKIDINKDQPRKHFAKEALAELAESISQNGLLQPIAVLKRGERYEIVAGERRFRAFRLLEKESIPAIVKNLTEQQAMELSLIENLQREDLNAVESAGAMRLLMDRFALTQQELAQKLGKSRSAVANTLRLLELPDKILQMIMAGKLTEGHARALAGLAFKDKLLPMAEEAIKGGWTVRETEKAVQAANQGSPAKKKKTADPHLIQFEEKMQRYLGTKVRIAGSDKRGKLEISYFNRRQLEGLLELLTNREDRQEL